MAWNFAALKALVPKINLGGFGEFFKSGSKLSSLRLKTVITVFSCDAAILIIVISEASKPKANWLDAAAGIAALGTVIGVALWGKNAGLAQENKDTSDTTQSPS